MIRSSGIFLVAALAAVMLAATPTLADQQTGNLASRLFNTGVDASEVVLAAGTADLHYTLDSVPSGPSTALVMTPHPNWLSNITSPASKWIGPLEDGSKTSPSGDPYVYTYSLDLTGFDPATTVITGRWATDNTGVLKVNGVDALAPSPGFSAWTPFTLNSGFMTSNTLSFEVTNLSGTSGNPTGLRVEFLTGNALPIPEPVFFQFGALMGLSGLGVLKLRRR